jgi:hypothetical protein
MRVLLTGYYSHKQTVCIVIAYINFYSCKVINMGNQRHGRKSRAASPKRKRGESTDQSELSDLNDILESI